MTDTVKDIIDQTVEMNMKLYSPQSVMIDRGEGVYVYDTQGGKCLDFAAGIAVASLGHAHPKLSKVIADQAAKIMACQGSYVTDVKYKASKALLDGTIFDEVYFSNSGAESVEMALKLARKWAYDNKGADCTQLIAFRNSFHGRTYGAASVTEKRHTQPFFNPYLQDVSFADFNDIESVKQLISDKTAGVIIEPLQGEGGLTPVTSEFLKELRALCTQHNVALIYDEIQCGSGRLGSFYAHPSFVSDTVVETDLQPDIVCLAKGMGSGFPVGAVVAKQSFSSAMVPGTHGSTYAGNPLSCAVVSCVVEEINQPAFLQHVRDMADVLMSGLEDIKKRSNKINRIAGKGLMLGIETPAPVAAMIKALRVNGLMTTQAGSNLVRLTPPLIVNEEQIKEALSIIEKTLQQDF